MSGRSPAAAFRAVRWTGWAEHLMQLRYVRARRVLMATCFFEGRLACSRRDVPSTSPSRCRRVRQFLSPPTADDACQCGVFSSANFKFQGMAGSRKPLRKDISLRCPAVAITCNTVNLQRICRIRSPPDRRSRIRMTARRRHHQVCGPSPWQDRLRRLPPLGWVDASG